jgi:potassium uptake TrkH family protein
VSGLGALALLLFEFGFPLTPDSRHRIIVAVRVTLWVIVTLQLLRAFVDVDLLRAKWKSLGRVAGFAMLLVSLAGERFVLPKLQEAWGTRAIASWETIYLTALHLVVLTVLAKRILHFNQLLAFARISPRAILIWSYVGLIVVGAALLKLPNATTSQLGWLDALFTSTSAVCVTGLIVVDTATAFTPFGQAIILLLFQLGGLGLMTFTYFFVALFGTGITIKDRALLLEFLSEEYVGRVTGSLIAIVVMTLAFELVGAALLHACVPGGWFTSLFHSVSAFCNAGFSVYSAGLYDPLTRSHVPYQWIIVFLVVLGGLGFPVLKNFWDHAFARVRNRQQRPPRLTLHSKLVLTTTAALIACGAVVIYLFELPVAAREGEAPTWMAALFMSVTARTAGFNTAPIDALLAPTVFAVIVLMFIGGSPASTAGGIKTTTFAVALLNTLRIMKDPNGELFAFRRKIPAIMANRAFAVALLALAWIACSTILLAWVMPGHKPLDVAFEVVSAFSTVGLSRGITGELPATGKVVIIASMLVGRIGILYVALGILRKDRAANIGYPEGNIIIS